MENFSNPHSVFDEYESLKRHHLAKIDIRQKQLDSLPIEPNFKILDIGSGPGLYLEYWLRSTYDKNVSFTLLDHSEEFLKMCKEIVQKMEIKPKISFIKDNFFKTKINTIGQFDLIFIGNTLEYVKNPNEFLKNYILPGLRPGGYLAIRDLDCGILSCNIVDPAIINKIVHARIIGCQELSKEEGKFHNPFIGRELHCILNQIGLKKVFNKPYYCEFKAPLNDNVKNYLHKLHTSWYIEDRGNILTNEEKNYWKSLYELNSPNCILLNPDFFYFETEFLAIGQKSSL